MDPIATPPIGTPGEMGLLIMGGPPMNPEGGAPPINPEGGGPDMNPEGGRGGPPTKLGGGGGPLMKPEGAPPMKPEGGGPLMKLGEMGRLIPIGGRPVGGIGGGMGGGTNVLVIAPPTG